MTTIGIDHVEYLGGTREQIAVEKAGIFKSATPAVIGEPEGAIRALLTRLAHDRGATPVRPVYDQGGPLGVDVGPEGTSFDLPAFGRRLRTPLLGAHQASNAAVALTMLDLLPEPFRPTEREVEVGLGRVHLPGRFQRVGRYIFDVAHNPDGAGVLARTLAAVRPPGPVVAVLSVLADKDWRGILRELQPVVDHVILTNAPTAPPSRAWDIPEPLAYAVSRGISAEVIRDFDRALVRGSEEGTTVVVTGSFHTVGDAMARLEVSPTEG